MRRLIAALLLCLSTLAAFGQLQPQYQVATVVAVNPHQAKAGAGSGSISYEVSIQVGGKVYVVLYTAPPGTQTVKYITGRQALVLVGDKTITYNNILGESFEVPILGQGPADAKAK